MTRQVRNRAESRDRWAERTFTDANLHSARTSVPFTGPSASLAGSSPWLGAGDPSSCWRNVTTILPNWLPCWANRTAINRDPMMASKRGG
jgi:hypothetical protein